MLTVAVLMTLVALSSQQCLTSDDTRFQTDPNARLALYTGQQEFSLDMLREVSLANPASNVFFSPYSTYQALLLAYFGSANQTEAALKKTLHINDAQDKLSTMQAYRLEKFFQSMRAVNGSESYEFKSSNRLFLNDKLALRPCMQQLFENEIQKLDFAKDPEVARQMINGWVENETKRQIKDLIPSGKITPDTDLILANAAYFKGLWQSKFQHDSTTKEVFFTLPNKKSFVSMMKQKGTFNHMVSERLGAHVLELPYKGNDISMFILLPPIVKENAIDAVIGQLTLESLRAIVSEDALFARVVQVAIPKFTIEQTIELTPILEKMNVGDLFRSTSDLSGFTGFPGLSLDEAIHKAKIEVDEEGTVAAAATAIFSFRSSRPLNPASFICNHPFIYLLFDRVSQTIIFMGVYRTPHN